jgi:tetratricopeptide (TPR) repeat protein
MLAALDRLDEARQLVSPLASTNPSAGLLLAAIDQDRECWAESTARYRAVLQQLARMTPSDPVRLWRVEAYEGLADNARRQKDLAGAVAVYQEALANVPEAEAYLHFQLGRQLYQGGRSIPALHHLRTAARLEPQHYAEPARPLIQAITQNTPGCLLRQ